VHFRGGNQTREERERGSRKKKEEEESLLKNKKIELQITTYVLGGGQEKRGKLGRRKGEEQKGVNDFYSLAETPGSSWGGCTGGGKSTRNEHRKREKRIGTEE